MAAPAAARDPGAEELSITKSSFGTVGSQPVDRYTLANHDMSVSILTYGAIVQAVNVPDRRGQQANVALNFAAIANYTRNGDYRGSIAGRYANRIAKGRFTLDGTQYSLDINNNPNTLHGGYSGFNTKVWAATPVQTPDSVGVKLTYTSPAGEGVHARSNQRAALLDGLPGHGARHRRVLAGRPQQPADRLLGDDRRADRSQPHQPLLLDPRRPRVRDDPQ
jgi:Galactose mutarotase and related enzymes